MKDLISIIKLYMAGVLPYIKGKNNKIYFLFARERLNNYGFKHRGMWSDFGGGKNGNEESLIQCAAREASEEMCGLLTKEYILSLIKKSNTIVLTSKNNKYTSYLVELNYENHISLPMYLNNNYKFMIRQPQVRPIINDIKNGLFEKDLFKWFSLDDIKTKRGEFRPFFVDIIDKLVETFV